MTDKKFTDEEIKKALECACSADNICNECPVISVHFLAEKALDLINRQQAKIADLEIELKAMRGAANSYKAEVERLQTENRILSQKRINLFERIEIVNQAREKAIKEFAERVKDIIDEPLQIEGRIIDRMLDKIDTLVKEMTGETKTDTE